MNDVRRGADAALDALRGGRPVIVVDDRDSEGELVLAAEHASDASVAFLVRHTSGYLCVAAPEERWEQLGVPRMPGDHQHGAAYGVAVDASEGVTTGISARERARTIRLIAAPDTQPADLIRPGHVVTERARPGGLLERGGHAEATVDLMRLAGLYPVGVRGHVVRDDGFTANAAELRDFALAHDLMLMTIDELVAYRWRHSPTVTRAASARMPTRHGEFTVHGYRDEVDGGEHLALVFGQPEQQAAPLVRVHRECVTGEVLGSRTCDCGQHLDLALAQVAAAGAGVVVYLRGTGLIDQLRAQARQDVGDYDTATAALRLVDAGEYCAAAHIVRDLGIDTVRLLTSNPAKVACLEQCGVTVLERLELVVGQCAANAFSTTSGQLGHLPAVS
ncbi:MAG: bifunctional 3,4-dihydroxy-2-butanone-4-phosphate synthase/GTP cyclohydrolase II [Actinophytocola sp.]|nr:bifunctional 3,4-dihydroxy-2-butanone-4-phosphate synthase/GTP cyclohydrolase II [Actinophytocola sp.]